jgi:hypothetical protein
MPKNPDWSKCMFYRLVCRDISITESYVGSTCNEVKRRNCHKSVCTNENATNHNLFVYRFIRSMGGWDNWQLIVHEKRPMNNRYEAKIRERYWCEEYKAILNKQVPSRTPEQYYVDHADELIRKQAAYNLSSGRLTTKNTCECGGSFITHHQSKHNKTKKHVAYLTTLPK